MAAFRLKSVSIHWELVFTRSLFGTTDLCRQSEILNEVSHLLDAGTLRPPDFENFGLIDAENLRKAHACIERGRNGRKIVLAGWS